MDRSSYPQGMHRTARTDDGDVETRDDACRFTDYTVAPDHGFAFAPLSRPIDVIVRDAERIERGAR